MNEEGLREELERVKTENEALKKRGQLGGSTMLKVSEKGAVSVYGLGRFPVTLYKGRETAGDERRDQGVHRRKQGPAQGEGIGWSPKVRFGVVESINSNIHMLINPGRG